MSCPVCGHTMQNLGAPERRIFWCQRCGTLKELTGEFSRVEMPIWLRHVHKVSGVQARRNCMQSSQVKAELTVRQEDEEIPRIDMAVFDHLNRRVV